MTQKQLALLIVTAQIVADSHEGQDTKKFNGLYKLLREVLNEYENSEAKP